MACARRDGFKGVHLAHGTGSTPIINGRHCRHFNCEYASAGLGRYFVKHAGDRFNNHSVVAGRHRRDIDRYLCLDDTICHSAVGHIKHDIANRSSSFASAGYDRDNNGADTIATPIFSDSRCNAACLATFATG